MTTRTRSIAFLHFVLTISAGVDTARSAASSGPCDRSILQDRYILSCKDKQLPAVPRLAPGSYDELTLAQNRITRVEDSAFVGISTRRLDLTGNPLVYVAPDAFRGLGDALESLLLSFDRSAAEFPAADGFRRIPDLLSVAIVGHGFRNLSGRDFENLRRLERLAITEGPLPSVGADLFRGQGATLRTLDLSGNELTAIPSGPLAQLRSLRTLVLARNRISSLGGAGESLRGLDGVESLDLSTQGSGVSAVDDGAFRRLETTLRVLGLASLSLTSHHLRALKPLTRLVELDLSRNRITHLGDVFVAMASLRTLNLQDNPVAVLDGAVFRNSASLRVLNLGGNSISSMEQDSFSGLTSLEDLDLGYSKGLVLGDSIFSAQRTTLKYLKLQYSKFLEFRWTAIENLTELQDLFLAECDLDDIPDYAFRNTRKLRSIDLKNNRIEALRRESFAGLDGSLEILNLLGNRIRTIDGSVFQGFARISLFQLSLQLNPLRCDCGLRWLHRWFANVTDNDGFQKNRISWTCSNLNGTYFRHLNDSHFEPCDQQPLPCPETTQGPPLLLPLPPGAESSSTSPLLPTNTEPRVRISLKVVAATSETLTLAWELSANVTVVDVTVTCEPISGGSRRHATLTGNLSTFHVTGLTPSTAYNACLEIPQIVVVVVGGACVTATTTSGGDLDPALIYGVSVAGALSLLFALFLMIVCYCCCCVTSTSRRRSRRRRCSSSSRDHVTRNDDEPRLGNNTKRFKKPSVSPRCQDASPPSSSTELQRTRSIADQLQSLTDDERYRLINLLTHTGGGSVASLDYCGQRVGGGLGGGLGGGSLLLSRQQRLPPPRYVVPTPASNSAERGSAKADHYEYIPDDKFYDEISTGDIV